MGGKKGGCGSGESTTIFLRNSNSAFTRKTYKGKIEREREREWRL